MQKFYQISNFKLKNADSDKAIIEGVFSSAKEDRHGDVVKQDFDLKSYKKNPVIINSHNYKDATEVVGKASKLSLNSGQLEGKIEFAVKENPKAKIIFDLYAGGFLNAFSIGFIPKEFNDKGEILKSELLEISTVSVPANAYALAKQKGIEIEKLYEPTISKNIKTKKVVKKVAKTKDKDCESGRGIKECSTTKLKGDETSERNGKKTIGNKVKKTGRPKVGKKDVRIKGKEKTDSKLVQGGSKTVTKDWDTTESEIRYKLRSVVDFEKGSFKRVTIKKDTPQVISVIGKLKGETKTTLQSLRFPKKDWALDTAKQWVKDNKEKIKQKLILAKKELILKYVYNSIKVLADSKEEKNSLRERNLTLINKSIRSLLKIKK